MTITIDWGAVLAIAAVMGLTISAVRIFVRDEIRKVTNGKFGRIEKRLGFLETAVEVMAEHLKIRLPRRSED